MAGLIAATGGTISYSPSFGYRIVRQARGTASTDGLDLSTWRVAGIGGDMIRAARARASPNASRRTASMPRLRAELRHGRGNTGPDLHAAGPGRATDTVDTSFWKANISPCPRATRTAARGLSSYAAHSARPRYRGARRRRAACCRTGASGAIFVRGPSLMSGYFGAPEETAARGFARTAGSTRAISAISSTARSSLPAVPRTSSSSTAAICGHRTSNGPPRRRSRLCVAATSPSSRSTAKRTRKSWCLSSAARPDLRDPRSRSPPKSPTSSRPPQP